MVTPVARREAAAHLGEAYGVSQRRACRTIGADRASIRYLRVPFCVRNLEAKSAEVTNRVCVDQ